MSDEYCGGPGKCERCTRAAGRVTPDEGGSAGRFADGTPVPTITKYRGRNVEDLTREELIAAVKFAAREIKDLHEGHQRDMAFMHDLYTLRGVRRI